MTTTLNASANVAQAVKTAGYVGLAIIALAPLSPVIGLMYLVKWLSGPESTDEAATVLARTDRPVSLYRVANGMGCGTLRPLI